MSFGKLLRWFEECEEMDIHTEPLPLYSSDFRFALGGLVFIWVAIVVSRYEILPSLPIGKGFVYLSVYVVGIRSYGGLKRRLGAEPRGLAETTLTCLFLRTRNGGISRSLFIHSSFSRRGANFVYK
jgi:hypothetical protein